MCGWSIRKVFHCLRPQALIVLHINKVDLLLSEIGHRSVLSLSALNFAGSKFIMRNTIFSILYCD